MLISIKNLLIFIERNSVGCHEIKNNVFSSPFQNPIVANFVNWWFLIGYFPVDGSLFRISPSVIEKRNYEDGGNILPLSNRTRPEKT